MRALHLCLRFCLFLLLCLPGCATRQHAQSAELHVSHSGNLKVQDKAEAPKLVYIDIHDSHNLMPNLGRDLVQALARGKFRPAESPSRAGYILHVTLLRQGRASADSLKSAVKDGYGKPVKLSGSGSQATVADALLTQRRVPTHKRPSHQKIKNISSRNALDSAQMRIGIYRKDDKAGKSADLSHALAAEIAADMN